jgi:hypothetical protein
LVEQSHDAAPFAAGINEALNAPHPEAVPPY